MNLTFILTHYLVFSNIVVFLCGPSGLWVLLMPVETVGLVHSQNPSAWETMGVNLANFRVSRAAVGNQIA